MAVKNKKTTEVLTYRSATHLGIIGLGGGGGWDGGGGGGEGGESGVS